MATHQGRGARAAGVLLDQVTQEEYERELKQKKPWYVTAFKHVISTAGLIAIIAGYLLVGGIIFREIELNTEITTKKEAKFAMMDEIEDDVDNITTRLYGIMARSTWTGSLPEDKQTWLRLGNQIIRDWQEKISRCVTRFGCQLQVAPNGEVKDTFNREYAMEDWKLPNAVLYAATIITTIGFGHIAPKTDVGRLITIVYALVGLPLMLLCLANIGDLMANGIRYMYGRGCCYCCNRERRRNRYKYKATEMNENQPDTEDGLQEEILEEIDQDLNRAVRNITVPISMTLVIIVFYLVIGAVLFAAWEDWSMIVGAYFSFTTMSTIGFGDFVPGATSFSSDSNYKIMLATIYILIGLAVISMCFSLMQEEMAQKFRWLGRKLGIVDEDLDEDDDDEWEDELTQRKRHLMTRRRRAERRKREKAMEQASIMRNRGGQAIPSTYNPPVIPVTDDTHQIEAEKKEMRRKHKKERREEMAKAGEDEGEDLGRHSDQGDEFDV